MRRLVLAAACVMMMVACGGAQKKTTENFPATTTCPVMKESFKPNAKTPSATYEGKTYYFCCPGCDKKFLANPSKYLAAAKGAKNGAKKADCGDDCDDCDDKKGAKNGAKKADCGDDCDDCDDKKGAKKGAKKADCGDDCEDCDDKKGTKKADTGVRTGTAAELKLTLPASVVCAVTGNKFKPKATTLAATSNGKTVFFCCPGCVKRFKANPEKYLK